MNCDVCEPEFKGAAIIIFFLLLYFSICEGLILFNVNIFSGCGVKIIFSNVESSTSLNLEYSIESATTNISSSNPFAGLFDELHPINNNEIESAVINFITNFICL